VKYFATDFLVCTFEKEKEKKKAFGSWFVLQISAFLFSWKHDLEFVREEKNGCQ